MPGSGTTTDRSARRTKLESLLLGPVATGPRVHEKVTFFHRVLIIRAVVALALAVILMTTDFDDRWVFVVVIGAAVVPTTAVVWRLVSRRGTYPPISLWADLLMITGTSALQPELFPFALLMVLAMVAFIVTVAGRNRTLAALAAAGALTAITAARYDGANRWALWAYVLLASLSTIFIISEFHLVNDRVHHRYDVLTGDLGLVVWEVADVHSTRLSYVTDNVRELLGHEPGWFYAHPWAEYIHPDDHHVIAENHERVRRGEDHRQSYRARRADGTYLAVEEYVRVERAVDGGGTRIWGVMTDASSKHAAMEAAELWASVVTQLSLPVFVVHLTDVDDDASLTITASNPAARDLVDQRMSDPVGRRVVEAFPELTTNGFATLAATVARTGRSVSIPEPVSIVRADQVRAFVAHVLALPNASAALVWTDATDRDAVASTLAREALTDNLTGLPNRRALFALLENEIARAKQAGSVVSYVALDLDRFKEINESLGHTNGDELLRTVGARLFALLSGIGRLHRLGADEFGVLLVGDHAANTERTARRMLATMTEPFDIGGYSVLSNASIGTATFPGDADDAEGLIRRADMALHRGKRAGLGLTAYSPDHDRSSARSIALLGDLRRGIEAGELVPYYQPVLDLTTGRLVAAEALVRWLHPVEGMVMPLEFVEAAEVSGLVGPLTERLAARVASDLERWLGDGHELGLAINLAARNVQDRHLAVSMAELLRAHRLPPRSLCLEITERTVMHDLSTSRTVLADMRDRGFEVAVDDFGTGYSSLAVLRSIPLDELKLDKTFVDDMAAGDARVVRSMIELGHNLGLRVVAEGVEEVETLERLRSMGCDRAQGWAIGRPMEASRFSELLERVASAPGDDSWLAARQPSPRSTSSTRPGTPA